MKLLDARVSMWSGGGLDLQGKFGPGPAHCASLHKCDRNHCPGVLWSLYSDMEALLCLGCWRGVALQTAQHIHFNSRGLNSQHIVIIWEEGRWFWHPVLNGGPSRTRPPQKADSPVC